MNEYSNVHDVHESGREGEKQKESLWFWELSRIKKAPTADNDTTLAYLVAEERHFVTGLHLTSSCASVYL